MRFEIRIENRDGAGRFPVQEDIAVRFRLYDRQGGEHEPDHTAGSRVGHAQVGGLFQGNRDGMIAGEQDIVDADTGGGSDAFEAQVQNRRPLGVTHGKQPVVGLGRRFIPEAFRSGHDRDCHVAVILGVVRVIRRVAGKVLRKTDQYLLFPGFRQFDGRYDRFLYGCNCC